MEEACVCVCACFLGGGASNSSAETGAVTSGTVGSLPTQEV